MIFRALLLCLLLAAGPAWAGQPTVDGHVALGVQGSAVSSLALSGGNAPVTSLTDDVLVIAAVTQDAGAITVSTVSGCGLSYALRKRASTTSVCLNGSINPCTLNEEMWWAHAAGTLSSCTVTVNFSGTASQAGIGWMAVNGTADPTSPWDFNVSLPYQNAGLFSVPRIVGPINTSPLDLLISFETTGRNELEWTPCIPSNVWNANLLDVRVGGSISATAGVQDSAGGLSGFASNLWSVNSANCPTGTSTLVGDNWVLIFDALTGTPAPTPSPNPVRRPFAHGWPW